MSVWVRGMELAAAAFGTLVMACGGEVAKLVNFVIKRRNQGALFILTRATLIALWSCVAFYCLLFHLGSIRKHEVMDTGHQLKKIANSHSPISCSIALSSLQTMAKQEATRVNFLYPR